MTISYKKWQAHLIEFGRILNNSTVNFVKNPSIGYSANFINGIISYNSHKDNISINQSVIATQDEAELSPLILKFHYENNNNLSINISRRDFFDKIFSINRIKSGNIAFDKLFTIHSNKKDLAKNIFSTIKIQEIFISHPLMTFNVITKNNITEIKIKHMQNKLYSFSEMKKSLDNFCYILSLIK